MSYYNSLSDKLKKSFYHNLYGNKQIINYSNSLKDIFLFLETLINKNDWNSIDIETIMNSLKSENKVDDFLFKILDVTFRAIFRVC